MRNVRPATLDSVGLIADRADMLPPPVGLTRPLDNRSLRSLRSNRRRSPRSAFPTSLVEFDGKNRSARGSARHRYLPLSNESCNGLSSPRLTGDSIMSKELEKTRAIAGPLALASESHSWTPKIVEDLAAADIVLQFSLQMPRRGREDAKKFLIAIHEAFRDLEFHSATDLAVDGDHVVCRLEGGGTHTGPAFLDYLIGFLPANSRTKMHLTGARPFFRIENGKNRRGDDQNDMGDGAPELPKNCCVGRRSNGGRSVDNDGEVVDVVPVDGLKLQDLAPQLLADRRVARLNIHLATDDSYAGRVMRLDIP